ncbi:endo alpha-1,4 polygalactosaminidase [Streptomyces sp. 35G-GA-8]|uniref:endo alpha-1,4 polygalactosaminidase n=1 Tax=Streptomyces sp. 35G-GA-8 TaxID=2939434 RepID=UPI00201EECEE|nr:endo alpha-1,4 polygalactosaminidase [Streptomyces sp. 35G-GA-8]MCL7381052.1 endo alpha-1,4 polygalactosaminidase [Streptomyces sp. 35G-GA-8]
MPFAPTARISVAPLLALALALSGCAATDTADDSGAAAKESKNSAATGHAVREPRANDPFDYQLGGAYDPPEGVRTVIRDRTAAPDPDPGIYNICYINAYQTQPDAVAWWRQNHPDLLLRDADGAAVIDEDWAEPLLDISSDERRDRLAGIVGGWIDGCADRGFDAVEADNLDSYLRSDGLLDRADAAAFAERLAEHAHRAGLAIGQKNAAEMTGTGDGIGFDFAVAEECARYEECDAYAAAYDDKVLVIEYRRADFTVACREWGDRLSVVLRDRDVVPAGEPGHVNARC